MLKTTFLLTTLVFDLEFEGHAAGMWRRNSAPTTKIVGLPCGELIVIVCRTTWAQRTSVTDIQIYDDNEDRAVHGVVL